MLRIAVVAVALLLAVNPAAAQGKLHSFANTTCSPAVTCPDDYTGAMSSEQFIANANACITQSFGYRDANGFFETTGLDTNGCLTPRPNAIPKGMGGQLIPVCCVAKQADNSCAFRCDLMTMQ